jgi:hypothetical protein
MFWYNFIVFFGHRIVSWRVSNFLSQEQVAASEQFDVSVTKETKQFQLRFVIRVPTYQPKIPEKFCTDLQIFTNANLYFKPSSYGRVLKKIFIYIIC